MAEKKQGLQERGSQPWTIVCESFGAGPGMGFAVHVEFRPTARGFSLWIHDEDQESERYRWRCMHKSRELLTWRNALRSLAIFGDVNCYDEDAGFQFTGIDDPVAQELFRCVISEFESSLAGDIDVVLAFTDAELEQLFERTGAFCMGAYQLSDEETAESDDWVGLADLAYQIRASRLSGKTFSRICELVGSSPDTPLQEVLDRLIARAGDYYAARCVARHRAGKAVHWERLVQHSAPGRRELRTELLSAWIHLPCKPLGGTGGGGIGHSGSPFPTLQWLLSTDRAGTLEAFAADYPTEFRDLVNWVLDHAQNSAWYFQAPGRLRGTVQHTFGRAVHGRIVRLARDVENAAAQAGIEIEPHLRISGTVDLP